MHNVTEGLCKSKLKIIWNTTREGGRVRAEERWGNHGDHELWDRVAEEAHKAGEYENQLLVFLSFVQSQILL